MATTSLQAVPASPVWSVPVTWPALRFGLTAAIASLLALYLAIVLELDQPYWAATTVLIVAQPVPGQVVGKGIYRGVGTVVGAVAGAALVALFAQEPATFVLALAAWIAATTGLATLLRGFRTYGAVLSGYTAAVVALSALPKPDTTFDIAVARGSAILLGVACGAVVSTLLLPFRSRDELLGRVADAVGDAARLVDAIGSGASTRDRRRRLVAELSAIELLGPTAAAEDLPLRRRLAGLDGVLSELLGVVSALRSVDEHLLRLGAADRTTLLQSVRPVLDRASGTATALAARAPSSGPEPGPKVAAAEERRTATGIGPLQVGRHIVTDRLHEALRHLARAVAAQAYLRGASRERPATRLTFHRDTRQAGRNALRAFLAVSLAGGFAIASAWSAGGTFLTNICVACSLFATQPRPSAAVFGFMRGAALALAAGFVVKFYVLPALDDFALLALALAPVITAATVATTVPGWLGTATAFNVLFLTDLAPVNTMTYDPASYLDGGVATLAAFAIGGLVFRTVLPADRLKAALRLAARLRADVRVLAAGRVRDPHAFRSLMYDRVAQIVSASEAATLAEGSISTLGVAGEVERLRALLGPGPIGDEVRRVLDTLSDGRPADETQRACDAAIRTLAASPDEGGPDLVRAVAALTALGGTLAAHHEFYAEGASP